MKDRNVLELEIKLALMKLFTETEYMELVYGIIVDDVVRDIEECADEDYNSSDVSLAVQRTLIKALNIEI